MFLAGQEIGFDDRISEKVRKRNLLFDSVYSCNHLAGIVGSPGAISMMPKTKILVFLHKCEFAALFNCAQTLVMQRYA